MDVTAPHHRLKIATILAVSLHGSFAVFIVRHSPPQSPEPSSIIAVKLVVTDVTHNAAPSLPITVAETPIFPDTLEIEVTPKIEPIQDSPPATFQPISAPPNGEPELNGEADGQTPSTTVVFDSRWTLTPSQSPASTPAIIGALSASLDCMKGFDFRCAEQRRQIFAEEQLSETDKVWMPTYAHSGLSDARFRGMSEAQIRAQLSIPTAGTNDWIIPRTNIGISSIWTDSLYGVNKRCKVKSAIDADGKPTIKRDCGVLAKGQKDQPLWRREDWTPGGINPEPIQIDE